MRNVLVVYFSRTGNTQMLAHDIARAGDWQHEAICDHERRGGVVGYLRCGFEAARARAVAIEPLARDVRDYDLVIVGTPVWAQSVSSPVRAFLRRYAPVLPRVAFFATCGGRGGERVLKQMAELAGQQPVATLIATERDLREGPFATIEEFVGRIRSALAVEHTSPLGPAPAP